MNEILDIKAIEIKVNRFLADAVSENYFDKNNRNLFSTISVGTQSALHPLFLKLPALIKNHLTPVDFFISAYPDSHPDTNLAVISFAFHFNSAIVMENSKETSHPSYSWYENRFKFEKIIMPFINFVKKELFPDNRVVMPYKSSLYSTENNNKVMTANWSERHIAYICGLGSFGLHGALITDKGCTHRLLSVVTDYRFKEYCEPQTDPYFNCLYFTKKSCGKCIERCPVKAIVPGEHIITKCFDHEMITNKNKSSEIFEHEIAACGLCMCGVPCSFKNPCLSLAKSY